MSPRESRDGLAAVERLQRGQLLGVLLDEVGELEQQPAAVGGVHRRPRAGLQRLAGGLDGPVDVGGGRLGDLGDRLAGGGVDGVERAALGRIDPLVVDEQFGLADFGGLGAFECGGGHVYKGLGSRG